MVRETRTDKLFRRARNHPIVAVAILVGAAVVAVGAFSDAAQKLMGFLPINRAPVKLLSIRAITDPDDVERFRTTWLKDRIAGFSGPPPNLIDITVLNDGQRPVHLKTLRVGVERVRWESETGVHCHIILPTWTYDLQLNSSAANETQVVALPHEIDPGKADRFVFLVTQNGAGVGEYKVRLTLHDESSNTLDLGSADLRIMTSTCVGRGWPAESVTRLPPS